MMENDKSFQIEQMMNFIKYEDESTTDLYSETFLR